MGGYVAKFRVDKSGSLLYMVVVFNDNEGQAPVNFVVGVEDEYGRVGNTVLLKTRALDAQGDLCDAGDFPFAFEFDGHGAADIFEEWYNGLSGNGGNRFVPPRGSSVNDDVREARKLHAEFVQAAFEQQDFKSRNTATTGVVTNVDALQVQHAPLEALEKEARAKQLVADRMGNGGQIRI